MSVNVLNATTTTWDRGSITFRPWIKPALILTVLFNIADAVLTLALVGSNLATEANPFMAYLLTHGPVVFVAGKMGLVFIGIVTLWRFRSHLLAALGTGVIFGAYALLMVYHVSSVVVLAGHFA